MIPVFTRMAQRNPYHGKRRRRKPGEWLRRVASK